MEKEDKYFAVRAQPFSRFPEERKCMNIKFFAVCSWLMRLAIGTVAVAPFQVESLASGLTYYSIAKGTYYHQETNGMPVLRPYQPWFFEAQMEFSNAPAGTIEATVTPPGSHFGIQLFPPNLKDTQRWNTQADLDAAFTQGAYVFSFFINKPPYQYASNVLGADAFPPTPAITNLAEAQSIDAIADFALGWNAFAGATTNDLIVCALQGGGETVFATPSIPGSSNALNGTAVSAVIPAGTLSPGRSYFGRLIFAKVQSTTTQYPGALGATLFESQTDFYLRTQGAGDTSLPVLLSSVPGAGAICVPTNGPAVMTFNKPMNSNWAFNLSGDLSSNAVEIWNASGTSFAITPPPTFAPGTSQTIVLNPISGQLDFADTNGNLLPPDTVINFVTGSGGYQSNLFLTSPIRAADGSIQINLMGATNGNYVLQSSSNLAAWTSIATNTPFDTTVNFADTNVALPCQFYRVIQ
jgi:hypothetical protein